MNADVQKGIRVFCLIFSFMGGESVYLRRVGRIMKRSTIGKQPDPWAAAGRLLPSWSADEWRFAAALVLAVMIAYLPVWRAGFVWDDRFYITSNPSLLGLNGLEGIWTSSAADISPLTSTVFWVEHALWGLAPLPYHLVNVFEHAACAVVLWRVLLALRVPGAWLGAALWALHPVQVESVAWVSELKNMQSGLCFLLSILFFLRSLGANESKSHAGERWSYPLSVLLGGLAMASKSSTVILPVVLCLVAWWMEGRWRWRNLARVAPFLVLSAAASALSLWTQGLVLVTLPDAQWVRSGPERLVTAGIGVWFYVGKELWPHPVMTVYPRWRIDAGKWSSYLPLVGVIVTLILLWLRRDSWARPWFFVFAYFLAALLPVLGLFDNYIFHYSLVFDHFQYLASMGPMALAGAGLARLARMVSFGRTGPRAGVYSAPLLLLGILTWQRCATFESEQTLWTDTLTKNPGSWTAHYNLGVVLEHKGQMNGAATEYRKALEINPNSEQAYNGLGAVLFQEKKRDEALAQFLRALELNPNYADAYSNLAQTWLEDGNKDGAIAAVQRALVLDPTNADAHYVFGRVLAQKGQVDAAIAQFKRALELEPDNADVHNNLGLALVQKGQIQDAISEYRKALASQPDSYPFESNLGVALFRTGQAGEGMEHLLRAAKISPDSPEAVNNLGNGYLATGQLDDAIAQYRKALAIDPNFFDARRNLAVALLYQGKVDDAIALLQAVLRLHPNDEATKGILAHAQAMAAQKPVHK
jgi:protein O-mannosyl-transferase